MTSPLPPKRRDSRNLADLLRQDRQRLSQLDRGLVGGRFPPARPLKPRSGDGDFEDDYEADQIQFLNTDQAACVANGATIKIPLTHVPEDGSEQVYYNGTPLKRQDWSRTDTILTIPGEPWFRAGKVAWVDYAYYDQEVDVDPATFVSVSWVQGNATSIPVPTPAVGSTGAGDLLVLAIAAGNGLDCTDPRMALKGTVTAPTFSLPTGGIWVGTDDGSGNPVAITSMSTDGNCVAAMMRIKGSPLVPVTSEALTVQNMWPPRPATFTPTVPTAGSFGVVAIASGVGLVSSTIDGDHLGNWTVESLHSGGGSGKTSVYLGICPTGPKPGQWSQGGSDPVFIGWMGGLQ